MAVNTFLGGGGNFLSPLISFYTFIDLETGLMNLIEEEYFDEDTFNPSFFVLNTFSKLHYLQFRHDPNPLTAFALHPEEDKEKLDEYYKQFMEEEIDKIMEMSYATDIYYFLESTLDTVEIRPTVLCYDKAQVERFKMFDEFHSIPTVLVDDLIPENYTQVYVKDLWELNNFQEVKFMTFYIAAYGPNLDEEFREFRPAEEFKKIIENRNELSVFTMYDKNTIGAPKTFLVDPRNKAIEKTETDEEEGTDDDEYIDDDE